MYENCDLYNALICIRKIYKYEVANDVSLKLFLKSKHISKDILFDIHKYNLKLLKILLDNNVDVYRYNLTNDNGETYLHLLCENTQLNEIFEGSKNHPCEIYIKKFGHETIYQKSHNNITPYDIAINKNNEIFKKIHLK
jgi:hypothetical protein